MWLHRNSGTVKSSCSLGNARAAAYQGNHSEKPSANGGAVLFVLKVDACSQLQSSNGVQRFVSLTGITLQRHSTYMLKKALTGGIGRKVLAMCPIL